MLRIALSAKCELPTPGQAQHTQTHIPAPVTPVRSISRNTTRQTANMCLFTVHKDEDDYTPVRVYERKRINHGRSRDDGVRYSRTSVNRSSYPTIPAPRVAAIPAPQPVPVFVKPPSPPPAAQYVTVQPRISGDDGYYRREVTVKRDVSRSRSRNARSRSRRRSRSRARYYDDDDDDYEYSSYRRSRDRY